MSNPPATATQTPAAGPFALQKKAKDQPKNVLELLQGEALKGEIAKVLPRHITPERMLRTALTTVKMSDKLQKVPVHSFASAMLKCSQYGLEPDGRHAHLIPFKSGKKDGQGQDIYDLQLIFDYKGLVALCRRSGEVLDIHCDVVYANDEFECSFGDGGRLYHKPNLKVPQKDRGEIVCAYSFVKLKDGGVSYEPMALWEIEAIRNNSQGYQAFQKGWAKSSPWVTSFGEMAKKTAFRRHSKWLTLSPELRDAIDTDDDEDTRFERAKPVAAEVLPADFSMPPTTESEQPEAEVSTPNAPTQPEAGQASDGPGPSSSPASPGVPNETLGAPKTRGPRKQKAQEQPKAEPSEASAPKPAPTTETQTAPVPNSRQEKVQILRDWLAENGATEAEFLKAAFEMQAIGVPAQMLASLGGDVLQAMIDRYAEIVSQIQ